MEMAGVIVLGILVGVAGYVVVVYNDFVTTKTRIKASLQEIGNQLKRQADLIPNLVSSVKGYMKHEEKIFRELTAARKAVVEAIEANNPQELVNAGARLQGALAPIKAVFESTPQLQAAGPTAKLMEELRDTADKVMYARRTLIDLTADYNVKVATFPSALVAKLFHFVPEAGLEVADGQAAVEVRSEDLKTPKVEL